MRETLSAWASFALVSFGFTWALCVFVLSLRSTHRLGSPRKWSLKVACLLMLLTTMVVAAHFESLHLRRVAREESSPERLRALYGRTWTRYDENVRFELARNKKAPPDVLAGLALSKESGTRYHVARNASTPQTTLEQLYRDPNNRKWLAANPNAPEAMLRQLANEQDQAVRIWLLNNPSVPRDEVESLVRGLGGAGDPLLETMAEGTSGTRLPDDVRAKMRQVLTAMREEQKARR